MVLGLDLLWTYNTLDDTFLVDDKGRTECAKIFAAIHALLTPYAEFLHKTFVCVGDK